MAKILDNLGFRSCIADPDVWRRPAVKECGTKYYEYVMTYVDDLIAISTNAKEILQQVAKLVKLKNDKIEPPSSYLGAKLAFKVMNGTGRWTVSSEEYLKAAVKNVEEVNKDNPLRKLKKMDTPMTGNYLPELDGTSELGPEDITLYQELIVILRWSTEIGRVDILHEVSLLSQYQASAREGHLEQLFNILDLLNTIRS